MKRVSALLGLTLAFGPKPLQTWAQSSMQQAGYLYLSPVPNAPYVSPQTRDFIVRLQDLDPTQVTNLTTDFITVTGALSGAHAGTTRVASDGRTVIFEIGSDFSNEVVRVTLNPQVATNLAVNVQTFRYQFMVNGPMPTPMASAPRLPNSWFQPAVTLPEAKVLSTIAASGLKPGAIANVTVLSNGVSIPSDFPQIVVTVNTNPSPGFLFLENGLNGVPPYTMIVDNSGLPVWYRRGRMFDFKIQKNGTITWCDGTGFFAFDQNFNYLKTYLATNGYATDGHELKVMPDGTYFLIGYRTNQVDLSQYVVGASTNALVNETVVQEFTAAGDLILQWRAWDNYDISDEHGNTDFPHMNAIDIDEDGNILVSSRHLSEVTKINRDSGEIIWRLGGAHSSFSFPNDPFNGPSFQHDISVLGNGHYMVFDNGNYHNPRVSRAAEYQLDLTNMAATLAWQFRDTPDKYADYQGSAQRLPSGNTLIDFVRQYYPKAIEVDTNGLKHFELSMVPGADSYRAFRLPWNGVVAAPYLIVEPQPAGITLLFNKFGDTNVAYFKIYGGLAPHPTALLDESLTTTKPIVNLPSGLYYFRVTAISHDGTESPLSNEESINVNSVPPGGNLVKNPDFAQGGFDWGFGLSGTASAAWSISNNVARIYITNGAASLEDVQLVQGGLTLNQGKQYVLEFDGWSAGARYIEVKLAQSASPFLDYSHITPPFLTPNPAHYRFIFTMQQTSDATVDLLFNVGASPGTIYLANMLLFTPAAGDLNKDRRVDFLDLGIFTANWLRQGTGLSADLNGDNKVDFNDFSILGQTWSSSSP